MRTPLLVIVLIVLASVADAQFGSQPYRPPNREEEQAAKRASKDIYPRDVRDSPSSYTATLVAWPGIVLRIDSLPGTDSIRLVLEHHYFDWREDHGCQRELYFVSPRGEGAFVMHALRGPSQKGFSGTPTPGALVLAYGTPIRIDTVAGEATIVLSPVAANAIEARWYRTDAFSYGRGFADFQLIKVPECSR